MNIRDFDKVHNLLATRLRLAAEMKSLEKQKDNDIASVNIKVSSTDIDFNITHRSGKGEVRKVLNMLLNMLKTQTDEINSELIRLGVTL